MFSENLKTLRKDRGFSQEQLSVRLNVVRQTISKWEKGLSVPDAQMLVELAEVLNVSVNDLLGENIVLEQNSDALNNIAMELEKMNELLTIQQAKRANLKKKIVTAIAITIFIIFILSIYKSWNEMFYEAGKNLYNWLH